MIKLEILKAMRFGERIAEEELNDLEKYFVATDQWNRVYSGEVDVVYGPKGSGKSAIYTLLDKKKTELFDRNILICSAENLRGSTAFSEIVSDPPPSERSFVALWKLYFLIISASTLREYGVLNEDAKGLIAALEKADLLPVKGSLAQFFKSAKRLIWSYISSDVESVDWTIALDPATGMPIASRKAVYRARADKSEVEVDIPLDELISIADTALSRSGYSLWILFDRLDVAFNDTPDLERNALRALFRMYNDFKGHDSINLKIFVRDDIWERISEGGFADASHITRTTRIEWSLEGLVNLFVRRLLNNSAVVDYLSVVPDDITSDFSKQVDTIKRILPDKVETGKNPETFKWMMNRIQDASGKPAPRELIHLADMARQTQISKLERGESEPLNEILFDRSVFKSALKEVSTVRYNQTFVAENPSLKEFSDRLRNQKAEQNVETLAKIWNCRPEEAHGYAERMTKAGFFEKRDNDIFQSYWVPFVYRDALELVQGKAFDDQSSIVEDDF